MVYIADVLDEVGEAEASRLQADGLDVTYLHLDIYEEQLAVGHEDHRKGAGTP